MKFVPFLAFPPREQQAILRALAEAGIARAGVCVSRLETGDWREALTTISTPQGCRTYGPLPASGWLGALQRDPPVACEAA